MDDTQGPQDAGRTPPPGPPPGPPPPPPPAGPPPAGSTRTDDPPPGQPSHGTRYQGTPRSGGPPAAGFFDQVRGLGLVRPDDRVAAGVAVAVARRLGIDPLLVRVGFVVLTVLGGVGVLAYGIGWLLLPQEDGRIHAQAVLSGDVTAGFVGAAVTVVAGFGGFGGVGPPWAWQGGLRIDDLGELIAFLTVSALVVVAVVVGYRTGWYGLATRSAQPDPGSPGQPGYVAGRYTGGPDDAPHAAPQGAGVGVPAGGADRVDLSKGGQRVDLGKGSTPWSATPPPAVPPVPPPTPPRPPRPTRRPPGFLGTLLAGGLALLVAGAVVVLDDARPLDGSLRVVALAAALATLALCLVVVGLAGRRSGGIGGLAFLVLVATVVSGVAAGTLDGDRTGERTWTPSGASTSYDYQLSAGQATLDLSRIEPGSGPVQVDADVSIGSLVVRVPDDLSVELDVVSGVGDVEGAQEGRSSIGAPGPADVQLSVDVSVGSLLVQEVSR